MKNAMYAFSGDPITYGHVDIIDRAASAFDHLTVAIGRNPHKKYLFSLEERTSMAQEALGHIPNATVTSFDGLLVDYAYEHDIGVIVKGVRNAEDSSYENMLHQVRESQKLGVDTHILLARPEIAHVSSSAVKHIQSEHGLIHEYVPINVKQRLEERISGQYIIGVTGEIASGKSYLSEMLVDEARSYGIHAHNIELDGIAHQILQDREEPRYQKVRDEITEEFGSYVRKEDGTIDRKRLGDIVFNDDASLQRLNRIMDTPLNVRIRKELQDKEGLVLLNGALIAESGRSYLSNNNTILVHIDKDTQEKRLRERGLTDEQIHNRVTSQYNHQEKRDLLARIIERDHHGSLWEIDNSGAGADRMSVRGLIDTVINELPLPSYDGRDTNGKG